MATTYTFSCCGFKIVTNSSGVATLDITVPGTFDTLNPIDPVNGRFLKSAMIWAESPYSNDRITALKIVDTDGVVPLPVRANFPNYPVIVDLIDTISGFDKAVYMPSLEPLFLEAFDTNSNNTSRFVPSGLHVVVTIQSGAIEANRNFLINIRWGAWS
jgi:hypothetical protein